MPTWAGITASTRRPRANLKAALTSRRPRRNPRLIESPPLELWEIRAAERSGINPATLKDELSELWRSTDSGKAFAAALDERGYVLAKGDRRDFCVIDQAGDAHSLARRLDGVKAKDVRERMSDLDRDSLPTVAEARAAQRETQRERTEALKVEKPALAVLKDATGAANKLTDFVSSLLSGDSKPPPPRMLTRCSRLRRSAKPSPRSEASATAWSAASGCARRIFKTSRPTTCRISRATATTICAGSSNAWSAGASVNAIGGGRGNGNGFPPTSRR